tara:strand:- start:1715 stop:1894 length:180 start_codon:yes stop_codon:yes gene_type:complete
MYQGRQTMTSETTPSGKRTIRTTVRGSVNGYIGGKFWVSLGERDNPHTDTLTQDFLEAA